MLSPVTRVCSSEALLIRWQRHGHPPRRYNPRKRDWVPGIVRSPHADPAPLSVRAAAIRISVGPDVHRTVGVCLATFLALGLCGDVSAEDRRACVARDRHANHNRHAAGSHPRNESAWRWRWRWREQRHGVKRQADERDSGRAGPDPAEAGIEHGVRPVALVDEAERGART